MSEHMRGTGSREGVREYVLSSGAAQRCGSARQVLLTHVDGATSPFTVTDDDLGTPEFHKAVAAISMPPYPSMQLSNRTTLLDVFRRGPSALDVTNMSLNIPGNVGFVARTTLVDFDDGSRRFAVAMATTIYAFPVIIGTLSIYTAHAIASTARDMDFLAPAEMDRVMAHLLTNQLIEPSLTRMHSSLKWITSIEDAASLCECMTVDEFRRVSAEKLVNEDVWVHDFIDFAEQTGRWHLVYPALRLGLTVDDLARVVHEISEVCDTFTVDGEMLRPLVDAHLETGTLRSLAAVWTPKSAAMALLDPLSRFENIS